MNNSFARFCTDWACCIFTEVDKVLTPNLDCCISILWSKSWFDGSHVRSFVIVELSRGRNITEVTWERYRKFNWFGFKACWTVFTLQANCISIGLVTLLFINFWSFCRTIYVGCLDNHIISSKSAFWIWVGLCVNTKWTASYCYSSITSHWTVWWSNAINCNFSIRCSSTFDLLRYILLVDHWRVSIIRLCALICTILSCRVIKSRIISSNCICH